MCTTCMRGVHRLCVHGGRLVHPAVPVVVGQDPFPLYSLLDLHDNQMSQVSSECRMCGKQVFQMEKIVAEKASWHKNCFRCKECNTILTLETYQSHEGVLYCKPHFKDLFRPKAVIEDPDEARRERLMRRPKMIVLESKPEALPDDVVRSTDKPDYGLEELSSANLRQKFAMFELISAEEELREDPVPIRRSQSLLNKAAKFMQSDGDNHGVENSELGEYEEEDEDEDEDEEEEEEEEDEEEDDDGKVKTKKGRP
ncbi:Xin actin-binding repeat-containing protein 2-like, partial [Homarus americanus]